MRRSERIRTVAPRDVVTSDYGTYRQALAQLSTSRASSRTYTYRYSYTIYSCPYARIFYASPGPAESNIKAAIF
eukprot:scaffold574122_cov19-Prasinocladus_malaysianus.AAC.1